MLWIQVDRSLNIPLKKQIFEQIRSRILRGKLAAGYRLPSSRELASQLNLSRNVVVEAYEQLSAEGYLETIQGSGTYVAQNAYLEWEPKKKNSDCDRNGQLKGEKRRKRYH